MTQVFYSSPWVPREWIKAHRLEPRGVWFARDFALPPLAAGICAFAESVVQLAETHPDSAMIFSTHCDQLRRGFDVGAGAAAGRVFLFNLPATWHTGVAERLFASELERLGRFLVALGGQSPNAERLSETIVRSGQARDQLLKAATRYPARQYCEAVARFHWDGSVNLPTDTPEPRTDAIPLAVVGGPLPASQAHVLDALESAGGQVVLDATEAGERSLGRACSPEQPPVAGCALPDLLRYLTRSFIDNCVDVFQRPNTRLYDWLNERLAARKVRGIVLWHYVGCDLWRAEAQPMREAFGLPVLLLEANTVAGEASRQTGRIEAFLESLR